MKIPLLVCVLLTACATTYQPYSYFGGGGYKDLQLSENSFKVTFEGNGYTSKTEATDKALWRAADLALEKGFKYFVLVSQTDDSSSMGYTTPSTSYVNTSSLGSTGYGTIQSYGGQHFNIVLPAPSLTILCFREKPDVTGHVYDADMVEKAMKRQYQ